MLFDFAEGNIGDDSDCYGDDEYDSNSEGNPANDYGDEDEGEDEDEDEDPLGGCSDDSEAEGEASDDY